MAQITDVTVKGITPSNPAWLDFGDAPLDIVGKLTITGTQTVTSGASADISVVNVKAATVTLTGTTQVTTAQGSVTVGIITLTDASAETVDSYASLYVAGQPVAGGSVTLTDAYAVNIAAGRVLMTPTRTVASATSANLSGLHVASSTLTVTGTTQITTATGFVRIGQVTVTDSMAVTIDTLASLYILGAPIAAGSVTLTAGYAIWVDAGNVRFDGNLTVSGGTVTLSAAATSNVIIANTAAAWRLYDGTTAIINVDTRNTVTGVVGVAISAAAPTITAAAGVTWSQASIAAKTITLTGSTGVTATDGLALTVGAQTITDSSAVTVTTASALYLSKVVAGGMVTITNNYIINTNTAGCFLTAAGTWTDASSVEHKQDITTVPRGKALGLLDSIRSVTYRYRPGHDDGFDVDRFGVIAQEVPDFIGTKERTGVAAVHEAGYLLAVVKDLAAEILDLKRQLGMQTA